MAGVGWFLDEYEPMIPTVDHAHERLHQHQTMSRYLMRKPASDRLIPNYPDCDIRDAISHYLVEVEVPGVKDAASIKCQWTAASTLIVSGQNARPGESTNKPSDQNSIKSTDDEHTPCMVVGERKIGGFRRILTFPGIVESEKMTAKLDAGVLSLNVPKHKQYVPKGDGKVKIDVVDG